MNVVGIAGDCEHNSAAALLVDGTVMYAEAEERLSGIKGDGGFPWRALSRAMAGLPPGERIFAETGAEGPRLRVDPELVGSYQAGRPLYTGELDRALCPHAPADVARAPGSPPRTPDASPGCVS